MKRSYYARLAELEKVHKGRVDEHSGEMAARCAREWVRRLLKVLRTEQGEKESLAEALARVMEISINELKSRLQEAAAGRSFWRPEELAVLQR